jgi:hypothetical protein
MWDYKKSEKGDRLGKLSEADPTLAFTKPEMAIELLKTITFQEGDTVMEPCKGPGAFFDNFPKNTVNVYCEIAEGIDYLEFEGMVDYTISNPPFVPRKLFWEFHQRAMQTTRKEIYWLLAMHCINVFTPNRLREMESKGWFIQNFHIVSDKRWFGRYAFIKFSKERNDLFTLGGSY